MEIDLTTIEALAPDQASLSAASKLTKRSNWPRLEGNGPQALVWGECQGSGANPYRVVVDTGDHGYQCTCPSRKFPCKHALALMWLAATAPAGFAAASPMPEWVDDWLGRRRKTAPRAAQPTSGAADKRIGQAARDESAVVEDSIACEPPPVRQRSASGRRIDAQAGTALAGAIRQADEAIRLVEPAKDLLDAWRNGLAAVLDGTRSTALVAGCAAHLLYEAGHLCADAAARIERPTKPHMAHMVLITDLHEGGNAQELLQRLAALVRSGANIELVRPNDEAPNTDHRGKPSSPVGVACRAKCRTARRHFRARSLAGTGCRSGVSGSKPYGSPRPQGRRHAECAENADDLSPAIPAFNLQPCPALCTPSDRISLALTMAAAISSMVVRLLIACSRIRS
ncbi:VWA domain-containing protein [Verminephrobacter eiseniae]|nr:VWA domain-containing protein [Verminephrobacter eiseniae]